MAAERAAKQHDDDRMSSGGCRAERRAIIWIWFLFKGLIINPRGEFHWVLIYFRALFSSPRQNPKIKS